MLTSRQIIGTHNGNIVGPHIRDGIVSGSADRCTACCTTSILPINASLSRTLRLGYGYLHISLPAAFADRQNRTGQDPCFASCSIFTTPPLFPPVFDEVGDAGGCGVKKGQRATTDPENARERYIHRHLVHGW